jgi:iron complex outermembrane receptor protein
MDSERITMKRSGQGALIALILQSGLLLAIGEPEKAKTDTIKARYIFNPVVVTAAKIAGTQRDLVASINLIDGMKLQQVPTFSVFEAVKNFTPGLYVTEWGVMGYGVAGSSAGKISMRGVGGNANTHVMILRNGRPDFMGLMGCTIADEFVTDGVERIEVLRGPASFLYGSNATGGVINIVSRRLTKPGFQTRVTGGYGSFDSRKFSVTHGGKIGAFDYYLTAATRRTEGHRTYSEYEGDHYTVHLGAAPKTRTRVEINATLADMNLFDPGPASAPYTGHWYEIRRYGGDLTLSHTSRWGESYVKMHGNFGRHRFFDGWYSRDRTVGIMVYHNLNPIRGNTTTLGWDWKRYGGNAQNKLENNDFGHYYITEWAPYIHTRQLIGSRFIASAGFRLEHHELTGYETLPKAGLVAHLTGSTSLRISIAKGFRSPSIRELYFFQFRNPDLKPERLWNTEIGINQHLGNRFQIEVAGFRSSGDNLIRRDNPGYPFQWINSGEFTHFGYEVIANWLPLNSLEMGLSWTHVDVGEETQYTPGRKLTIYARSGFMGFNLGANLIHVRELYGMDSHKLPMENYTLVHLSLHRKILNHVIVRLALKNALNADYQSMYGYPMPGRHVMMDMELEF